MTNKKAEKLLTPEDRQLKTTHNETRRIENISYKHEYTDEEKLLKGDMQAQLQMDKNALEEEKKTITNEFKTKIDEKETQINKVARELNGGFEMRNGDCEVIRDFEQGKKRAYLNGKMVKEEALQASDYQTSMPL